MNSHPITYVETIEDFEIFEKLREEWTALLSLSPSDCLFLSWEWLFTWWKHLAGDRRLRLLVVRSGGELIAIAPLACRPRQLGHLLSVRVLEFLGTGSVGSDYLDLIVRRGRAADAARALAAGLDGGAAILALAQAARNPPGAGSLADELGRRGWSLLSARTSVCPFVDLAGLPSWDAYLKTLGAAHRYNFRRRLRQLSRLGEVRLTRVEHEAHRPDALRDLVTLHQLRWHGRGGSSGLHTPLLVAFHEEFSRLALARGWLRLYTLRLDGKPIASIYGFRYADTFYFYQSGFDPRYARLSVGMVALGLTIKAALEEGMREFDLLHGDEEYKSHWARQTRELRRLELYPPTVRTWLYRHALDANRGARRVARRAVPASLVQAIVSAWQTADEFITRTSGAP